MVSNNPRRWRVSLRRYNHLLLVTAVVSLCAVSIPNEVQAGFFDNLKKRAEKVVKDQIPDVEGEKRRAEKKAEDKIIEPLEDGSRSGFKSQPGNSDNNAEINSVVYLMDRWPFDGKTGKPVKDVELRGVRLGQPYPVAHKALINAGFSYMRRDGLDYIYGMNLVEDGGQQFWISYDEYRSRNKGSNFKIIRGLQMNLRLTTPSEPILAELPKYPGEFLQTQTQAASRTARESRANRTRRTAAQTTVDPTISKEPLYVSGFEYNQRFISGEQVDWKQIMEQAREQFGTPNYEIASTQRQGEAYKSGTNSLWYHDAALVPRNEIQAILERVKPQRYQNSIRQMVWRDMLHPGIFSKVSYNMQYSDNYNEAVDAMRVAGAPYMEIAHKGSSLRIRAGWPFLASEKSYRELYQKDQKRKAQPKAKVKF